VVTPWLIEGPINGESFLPYVERFLAPALSARRHRHYGRSRISPRQGDPRCHPGREHQSFFLAKYSRDLKPIEMFFAELKQGLQSNNQLPDLPLSESLSNPFRQLTAAASASLYLVA